MSYFPLLPTSFNTPQTSQDGNYRAEYEGNFLNARYNMVQRALEKERIREEVIAEMAEKLALEAHVRREILMRREFSVQMMHQPDNRIAINELNRRGFIDSGVVDTLPFQRYPGAMMSEVKSVPQATNKQGQSLLLPKPNDTNFWRTKTIVEKPAACATELPAAKEKNQELSCALCQVNATSEQALMDHIQGKKHKAKVAKLKVKKHGTKSKHRKGRKGKGRKRTFYVNQIAN